MPEEVNRVVVDAISDLLWTPSADADQNLLREGRPVERIVRIGNVMIDAYRMLRSPIAAARVRQAMGLGRRSYGVVTLHRPSNVDELETLAALMQTLSAVAGRLPLVFPVHPRTRQRLEQFGLWQALAATPGLLLKDPLSYVAFMSLVQESRLVITDSGGVQEETTYLHIPCLTLRTATERPITVSRGTNRLVKRDDLLAQVDLVLRGDWPRGDRPELWDGRAARRAAASLRRAVLGESTSFRRSASRSCLAVPCRPGRIERSAGYEVSG
jgi:UDP-N-acetylglucosamine 2-epimerase (non-hydrolysing)